MTALPPLAYGYLRDDLVGGSDGATAETTLRAAATALGYELGTVFHEPPSPNGVLPPVFIDLVQECRRAAAHSVITLPGHLSGGSVCSRVLRARAEVVVHEVGY
ncbi:hypothetical protein ABZV91_11040 [Nocardia sp. NPDC004568]|uniref:hypothetical protein n=1 Tax=Nocardia sp. NPDC004568 TaxID=3154551 RepID=UPI0033B3ACCF